MAERSGRNWAHCLKLVTRPLMYNDHMMKLLCRTNILGTVNFNTFHPVIQENFSVFAVVTFHQELSYSKPFHDNLNYSCMANIEEIVKFYNLDN